MKKVHFNEQLEIPIMYVWQYASQTARHGQWEQMARDRERFKMRIERMKNIIDPVLRNKYNDYLKKNK